MLLQRLKVQVLSRPEGLCVAMLLGLLPLICQYVLFHPDEQHYVDAGVKMIESGDYLTPLTPEGELRFRKPIIPYWFVLAGYQTFGISALGSRLAFALGACLLVWLTWKTADLVFESRTAGMFAALIVMCHPAVLISAARAVPDMCLALFTALSCYGFVAIIRKQQVTLIDLLAAYGGGVLAVLSKGIPAAAFVMFATAFLVLRERRLFVSAWARFGLAIVGAVLGSLSWFLWMWIQHGGELIEQFVGDQVGQRRFADSFSQIILQALQIVAILSLTLSPWLVLNWSGIARAGCSIRTFVVRSEVQLLLSWCCVYIGLAATISFVTMRYLLPIIPLLAVCCGGVLARVALDDLKRPLRMLLCFSLMLAFLATTLFSLTSWSDHPQIAGVFAVVAGIAIVACWLSSSSWGALGSAVGVGCAVYGAIGLASWGAYPVLFPSVATQVAETLQDQNDSRPLLLISKRHQSGVTQAAKLRVAFAGRRQVILASPEQTGLKSSDFIAVLSDDPNVPILSEANWELQRLRLGFAKIALGDVIDAAISGRLRDVLARSRTESIYAKRNESSVSTETSKLATSLSKRKNY